MPRSLPLEQYYTRQTKSERMLEGTHYYGPWDLTPRHSTKRSKLSYLRQGIARNDERPMNLETSTTEHDTPSTRYHRPRQLTILPGASEIGTPRQWLPSGTRGISHPVSLQARRRPMSGRIVM